MSDSESDEEMKSQEQKDVGLSTELSNISFQDLSKYTDQFDVRRNKIVKRKKPEQQFHRENKNRPKEMSSKRPKPHLFNQSQTRTVTEKPRDPRFDKRTGAFHQESFQENYKFINKIKQKEYKILSEKLNDPETSPEERENIKFLIQRQKNQNRELTKLRKQKKLHNEQREYEISQLKQGKKPFYQKKSTEKLLRLAEQFEDLKSKGALSKHMKRHRKKKLTKDRIKMSIVKS